MKNASMRSFRCECNVGFQATEDGAACEEINAKASSAVMIIIFSVIAIVFCCSTATIAIMLAKKHKSSETNMLIANESEWYVTNNIYAIIIY